METINTALKNNNGLKRWLRIITTEGAFANVFITLTGGAFATGLALMLGANDFEIGLLAAIPFIAQVTQLLSSFVSDNFKSRKSAVCCLALIGRQVWWLIPLILVFNIGGKLELTLLVILISNIAVMMSTPVWLDWMADIVPEKKRGRYFGYRSAVLAVITIASVLAGGMILDYTRSHNRESLGFIIIIVVSCICAAVALILLQKIPDMAQHARHLNLSLSKIKEPLTSRPFRKLLMVFFAWNFSIGISAPFFAPHMLTNLEMSFTLISIYSTLAALTAVIFNKAWGAMIDRFGSRSVMAACAFSISIIPLIWLFPRPDTIWILIPEAIYSGTAWTGFNLAAFNIPIANSPKHNRSYYLAMFNVITGLGFFAGSMIGGVITETLKDVVYHLGQFPIVNYQIVFVVSSGFRLATAGLSLTFHEPREKSIPIMIQFMGYNILKKLSIGRQLAHWSPKQTPDK